MDYTVLLGLVTSGAGMLFGKPRKGRSRDAWQAAAEAYGLLHKPSGFWSGPKLTGRLSGNDLTVDMQNRSSASAATRFRLSMPSLNLGLKLRKKGFWNSLRPRTVIGDKAFDSRVVAEGRNEWAVREFLTPERRTALQGFLSSFKGAVVTDNEISFKTPGYVRKPDQMIGAIEAMMRVAHVLAEERPSTLVSLGNGPRAAAIAQTDTGERAALEPEALREPAPMPEPAPDPELARNFAPWREPEMTHANETELTASPANEPDDSTVPAVEATDRLDSLASPDATPGVEEFCATVFAPGALSFAANQKFRDSYEGQRIDWTGTLESITPFAFDFDFASGRGIKAVLTILECAAAGSRKVQAVIGLPPGIEGLDERIGQTVEFTGRLLKVEGLEKRVLIADAELRP